MAGECKPGAVQESRTAGGFSAYKMMGTRPLPEKLFNTPLMSSCADLRSSPRDHALFRALVEQGAVGSATADALVSEDTRERRPSRRTSWRPTLFPHTPRTTPLPLALRAVLLRVEVFGIKRGKESGGGNGAAVAGKKGT